MKNKQKSIFYTLFLFISFTILIAVFIVSKMFYDNSKEHLIEDVNSDVQTSLLQLKNSIHPFMDSYSVNEYETLLENELKHRNILAIIVDDYNMSKFTNSEYLVGKVNNDGQTEDYDKNNELHQEKISN